MKKIIALLFVLVCMATIAVPAVATTSIIASGDCGKDGDNVKWTLSDDGVLTIYGEGEMRDLSWGAPWFNYGNPQKVIIEEGVTSIGDGSFQMLFTTNPYLKEVMIASTVKIIGKSAFAGCEGLREIILPEELTTIRVAAFGHCTMLKTINIPRSVKSIESAFAGCESLETIIIPDGILVVSDRTFYGCKNLKEVSIPDSVVRIEEMAFFDCDSLTDVWYAGTKDQWNHIEIDNHYDETERWKRLDPYVPPYYLIGPIGYVNAPLLNATLHCTGSEKDEPSDWAKDETDAAITAGLVPENLQKNYQLPVSRSDVAQMFINLIEQSSGKPINEFMGEMGVEVNPSAFTDTSDKAVLAANALGIIQGIGNNKFDPDGTFTRAQIAAIINRIARVLGVDTDGYSHSFSDVVGHWVDAELGWPSSVGIINGVGDNKFSPDTELTTEQAIAITYRALQVLKQ